MKSITIYANKGSRRNTKFTNRTMSIYDITRLKQKFTKHDIYELLDWCICQKYNNYNLVVADHDTCLCTIHNYTDTSTYEVILNRIYKYMEILNMEQFDFTLSQLHSDSNIRYLLNKAYND